MLALKLETDPSTTETFIRRYPKIATVTTILVSGLTFTIYFMAIGLILREFKVSLTAYLASASVIGLAVGFGLQGLIQDVIIGLTLIFSDVLSIEDVVELSGQVGKVENIGLRFTTLVNLHGQQIYVPNRNIAMISRFRRGAIRIFKIYLNPNTMQSFIRPNGITQHSRRADVAKPYHGCQPSGFNHHFN